MILAFSTCFIVRVNIKDEKFLFKASQIILAGIEFGKIALTRNATSGRLLQQDSVVMY